ncbi:hypothetical protein C8R43DRAFT_1121171 [Mycena crocata]|nr:hypothetical protein C8R43DRAFT_1121171 [Mycena crocata]
MRAAFILFAAVFAVVAAQDATPTDTESIEDNPSSTTDDGPHSSGSPEDNTTKVDDDGVSASASASATGNSGSKGASVTAPPSGSLTGASVSAPIQTVTTGEALTVQGGGLARVLVAVGLGVLAL